VRLWLTAVSSQVVRPRARPIDETETGERRQTTGQTVCVTLDGAESVRPAPASVVEAKLRPETRAEKALVPSPRRPGPGTKGGGHGLDEPDLPPEGGEPLTVGPPL
jgi:hypothetical protein